MDAYSILNQVFAFAALYYRVPYTGQGAQMGLEDVGTLAMLLKEYCLEEQNEGQSSLDMNSFGLAMKSYEKIRIPRALEINKLSKTWGESQSKRSKKELYREVKEEKIKRDVFFHETLSCLIPGSTYNYREAVAEFLEREPKRLPALQE